MLWATHCDAERQTKMTCLKDSLKLVFNGKKIRKKGGKSYVKVLKSVDVQRKNASRAIPS